MNRSYSFRIGSLIEVHSAFGWQRGFEVAGSSEHGYKVRRRADHYLLPADFTVERLRLDLPDAS